DGRGAGDPLLVKRSLHRLFRLLWFRPTRRPEPSRAEPPSKLPPSLLPPQHEGHVLGSTPHPCLQFGLDDYHLRTPFKSGHFLANFAFRLESGRVRISLPRLIQDKQPFRLVAGKQLPKECASILVATGISLRMRNDFRSNAAQSQCFTTMV